MEVQPSMHLTQSKNQSQTSHHVWKNSIGDKYISNLSKVKGLTNRTRIPLLTSVSPNGAVKNTYCLAGRTACDNHSKLNRNRLFRQCPVPRSLSKHGSHSWGGCCLSSSSAEIRGHTRTLLIEPVTLGFWSRPAIWQLLVVTDTWEIKGLEYLDGGYFLDNVEPPHQWRNAVDNWFPPGWFSTVSRPFDRGGGIWRLDISSNSLKVCIMDPGDGWSRGGSVEERWKKGDVLSVSVLPSVFVKVTRFQAVDMFGSVVTQKCEL